jgi:uncharacterized membrane protein
VEFARLAIAASAWFLLHAAIAGSGLRSLLVRVAGDKTYRRAFSAASVLTLWWLVYEYGHAPYRALWVTPAALYFVPLLILPWAFVLLVGAFVLPSPTALGGEKFLVSSQATRGVLRVTRHPFLWCAVLWAGAHLLVNADAGSLIFFGALGLTALRGSFDIDRKRRRTHPTEFARFEAETSNVPLAAVLAGRNRLVLRELWLPLLLGLALALGAIALHPRLFSGASAVPSLLRN